MNTVKGARRGIFAGLIVVLSAVAVAACGGSSSSSSASAGGGGTSTTSGGGQFTALRECLKEHGVTLGIGRGFGGAGRPGTGTMPSGGAPTGGGIPSGTGTAPSGGAPTGGAPTGTGTVPSGGAPAGGFAARSAKDRAAFEACDKKLGIKAGAGFGAGRGFGRYSAAALVKFESCMKDHGVTLTRNVSGHGIFSLSAMKNPKFKTAYTACRSDLGGFGGPGQTGTGTSTGTSTTSTT